MLRRPARRMTNLELPTNIEHWPLERLVPSENNARTHSSDQIKQLANSIREFGFTNPILVDSESGILAGHARLCAARSEGLKTVPVIVLDHFTDIQKRAYILADNQLALNAGWDDTLLAEQLVRLEEEGFPLETIGFDDEALTALLGEHTSASDPDSVPEIGPVPISRSGDIWLLGSHRVHGGDATTASAVELLMAGQRANMVFTDPPYNAIPGTCSIDAFYRDCTCRGDCRARGGQRPGACSRRRNYRPQPRSRQLKRAINGRNQRK
jgi:ParB-like nuclease family protein